MKLADYLSGKFLWPLDFAGSYRGAEPLGPTDLGNTLLTSIIEDRDGIAMNFREGERTFVSSIPEKDLSHRSRIAARLREAVGLSVMELGELEVDI